MPKLRLVTQLKSATQFLRERKMLSREKNSAAISRWVGTYSWPLRS